MLIIWGWKRTERKLGFVADFCPICREIRPFTLVRVGSASHVYYISFGKGQLIDHQAQCSDCGLAISVDPLRYASFAKLRPTEIIPLIQATYPTVAEDYAERLAIESQLKRTPSFLTPEERASFVIEPFRLLNPILEARFKNDTKLDKQSGIGCLGTILISVALLVISTKVRMPWQDQLLLAAGVFFGIGTVYTFIQLALGPGRFLRNRIIPSLARSLDPLEPTQGELSLCIEKCKTAQMKIGQKLKIKALWAELERRAALDANESVIRTDN